MRNDQLQHAFAEERMSEAGSQPRFPQMEQPVMKRITLSVAATVAGLVIGPSLASALTAMTTEPTNLRAGPAFDFPVVDRIPDDARVTVHGCVRAYRWCDISWRRCARAGSQAMSWRTSISSGMCRLWSMARASACRSSSSHSTRTGTATTGVGHFMASAPVGAPSGATVTATAGRMRDRPQG